MRLALDNTATSRDKISMRYIGDTTSYKARRNPLSEFDKLIRYYDDNVWKRYFSIDMAELYRSVKGLLALREELRRKLISDTVGNLISESETHRAILLGGFRADVQQPFTGNSLALFYKKVFGIGISDADLIKIIIG